MRKRRVNEIGIDDIYIHSLFLTQRERERDSDRIYVIYILNKYFLKTDAYTQYTYTRKYICLCFIYLSVFDIYGLFTSIFHIYGYDKSAVFNIFNFDTSMNYMSIF